MIEKHELDTIATMALQIAIAVTHTHTGSRTPEMGIAAHDLAVERAYQAIQRAGAVLNPETR